MSFDKIFDLTAGWSVFLFFIIYASVLHFFVATTRGDGWGGCVFNPRLNFQPLPGVTPALD